MVCRVEVIIPNEEHANHPLQSEFQLQPICGQDTPGSINSVKAMNFLLCHSPLPSSLPSFQSPCLAPFPLLFPLSLAHSSPLVMRSLQRAGWARCPCMSLQTGPCCAHPAHRGLAAAPRTGVLARAPLLQAPVMPQLPAQPPPTMNPLLLGYIPHSGELAQLLLYRIFHKFKGKLWVISALSQA